MSQPPLAVGTTDLPGLLSRGKVRDIYDLGDKLMIVATDRISAFDVVMNQPVSGKGLVLTELTRFWLELLPACAVNHLEYVVSPERVPAGYQPHLEQLRGRAMVVRKATVLPIECVVRGYLVGGGWKEYQSTGSVSGIWLEPGLQQAQKLPEPIFTPSTKATDGHDQPVSFEQACVTAAKLMMNHGAAPGAGKALMVEARRRSLEIYHQARDYAENRGIIIADTKFEFGMADNELILIDEVLTPDSSRFWPTDQYRAGGNPPSFDKQFVRDYLAGLDWNKQPPPPPLPDQIIAQTRARYLEAGRLLTGRKLVE